MSARIAGLSMLAPNEQHSDNAWETPEWLVDRIHALLGGIGLDPCTTPENPTRAARFYTPADDGILQAWDASPIYCNPPYGKTIRHWVRKCIDAGKDGHVVLLLVPARTDPSWFQDAWNAASDALFFRGRLKFQGAIWNAPFPSALIAYNASLAEFSDLGIRSKAP
jgi:site-specific DNA-methyltransferase (adenine-specific)